MFAITIYTVRERDKLIAMQYDYYFAFVLLAAVAYAAKRCPDKEDNTVYLSGFFCMSMFRQIDMNMQTYFN